jgi:hypothetical protein
MCFQCPAFPFCGILRRVPRRFSLYIDRPLTSKQAEKPCFLPFLCRMSTTRPLHRRQGLSQQKKRGRIFTHAAFSNAAVSCPVRHSLLQDPIIIGYRSMVTYGTANWWCRSRGILLGFIPIGIGETFVLLLHTL